jgi:hypothetical protein
VQGPGLCLSVAGPTQREHKERLEHTPSFKSPLLYDDCFAKIFPHRHPKDTGRIYAAPSRKKGVQSARWSSTTNRRRASQGPKPNKPNTENNKKESSLDEIKTDQNLYLYIYISAHDDASAKDLGILHKQLISGLHEL